MAIGPRWPCPGDRDRISAGCSHQAVEMLFPGSVSMGYRPVGVGLTGRGRGTETPPTPVSTCHRERFSMRAVEPPPPPDRSSRPPPAPFIGGGQFEAVVPVAVCGGGGGENRTMERPG